MKTSAALGLTLLLVATTGAHAQDGKPDPNPAAKAKPAEDEAKPVESDESVEAVRGIRYRIELKSGGVLDGVIRAKGVFERRGRAGGYEPAGQDDPRGGVRIWFPSRQDGFIFLPVDAIDRLDELGSLSADEGKSLARARVAARRRAKSERDQIKAARAAALKAEQEDEAADGVDEEGTAGVEGGEAAAQMTPEEAAAAEAAAAERVVDDALLADLLIKYPPTRWSPDTPDEIERRKVVLGLFPSDEEVAFLDTFDDWLRAYNSWLEANGEEAVAKKDEKRTSRTKRHSPRKRPDVKRPETPRNRE